MSTFCTSPASMRMPRYFSLLVHSIGLLSKKRRQLTGLFPPNVNIWLFLTLYKALFTENTVASKKQQRKHKYKQGENNEQVHHSSWHLVLEYKQNIIYNQRCSPNLITSDLVIDGTLTLHWNKRPIYDQIRRKCPTFSANHDMIRITELCRQHTELSQQTEYLFMYHSQNALKVVSGH